MKWFVWLVFAIVFGSLQLRAAGKSTCDRRFTVAMNTTKPLFFRDSNNQPQGIGHDILLEVQKRTGCIFHETEMVRPLTIDQMANGRLDLILIAQRGDEFEKSAEFFPIYKAQRELALRKDVFSKTKKVSDYLEDKKIIFGGTIGAMTALMPSEDKKIRESHRMIEFVDYQSAFEAMAKNRIQAIMLTPILNSYYISRSPDKDKFVRIVNREASNLDAGIYLSNRRVSEEEKKKLKEAFMSIVKDGTLQKILNAYKSEGQ